MVGNRTKKKGGGGKSAKLTITGPLMIQAADAVCDHSDLVCVCVSVCVHIRDVAVCQVIRRDVRARLTSPVLPL